MRSWRKRGTSAARMTAANSSGLILRMAAFDSSAIAGLLKAAAESESDLRRADRLAAVGRVDFAIAFDMLLTLRCFKRATTN